MNNKEIAIEIINKVKQGEKDIEILYISIKNAIENLLVKLMQQMKDISGEIKDEQQFLDILAEIGDELVNAGMFEAIDGFVFRQILGFIDKNILDKLIGKDWFLRLQGLVK